MFRIQPRPCGGASALWQDVHDLAALASLLRATPSNRTRTQGALPDHRRGALSCQ